MPKKNTPRYDQPIEYEFGGVTYSGHFYIEDGWVTVRCSLGSKGTHISGSSPEALARIMFGEILQSAKATKQI